MTPRLNRWIVIALLALAIPWYWLFVENDPGPAQPKAISIAQLRALATGSGGELPERIRYEALGSYEMMGNLAAAGTGMRINRLSAFAYVIQFDDRPPILIGSGVAPDKARALEFEAYSAGAQARVVATLQQAQALVPLDMGPLQTGGLTMLPQGKARARIERGIAQLDRLDARQAPYRLAPGVVVIPTPGRQRGSRLVFVRTVEGLEFLFAGNLARQKENWTQLRAPAVMFTTRSGNESREETYSWLLTLRKLKDEDPRLLIVSGTRFPRGSRIERFFPKANRE